MATIKQRIKLFQNQAPQRETSFVQDKLSDLRNSISRATGGLNRQAIKHADPQELKNILGGEWLSENCLLIEHTIPLNRRHGNVLLKHLFEGSLGVLDEEFSDVATENLVFLDTETSGLNGGSGTLVFLLGMARVCNKQLVLRQYLLTAFSGEKAMLSHACNWFTPGDVMVSYNGKSFDLPLLESRCRLHGLALPAHLGHLDLLHFTRRAFSHRWPSCTLKNTERRLLAFHRMDDIPGSQIPSVWREFVRFGLWQRLPSVLQHHYWDILSLGALLVQIRQVYEKPASFEADVSAIARFYVRDKREELAKQQLLSNRKNLSQTGLLELANLYKRLEKWDKALEIWQKLVERYNCPSAMESLAKYYEHHQRDYHTAMLYAQQLNVADVSTVRHRQRITRLSRRQALLVHAQ